MTYRTILSAASGGTATKGAAELACQLGHRFAEQALRVKSGEAGLPAFHRSLKGLCRSGGIDLSGFPAFSAYADYVELAGGIDRAALLAELGRKERSASDALSHTPAQKALVSLSRDALLAGKLLRHAVSPEEWTEWTERRAALLRLPGRLRDFPMENAAPDRAWEDLLEPFEGFCRTALERDVVLALNFARFLKDVPRNDGLSVLVAGGFHTDGLARTLREKGFGVAVLTPRVSRLPEADYADLFDRRPLPLETLFAGRAVFLVRERASGNAAGMSPGALSDQILFSRDWAELSFMGAVLGKLSAVPGRALDAAARLPGLAAFSAMLEREGEVIRAWGSVQARGEAAEAYWVEAAPSGLGRGGLSLGGYSVVFRRRWTAVPAEFLRSLAALLSGVNPGLARKDLDAVAAGKPPPVAGSGNPGAGPPAAPLLSLGQRFLPDHWAVFAVLVPITEEAVRAWLRQWVVSHWGVDPVFLLDLGFVLLHLFSDVAISRELLDDRFPKAGGGERALLLAKEVVLRQAFHMWAAAGVRWSDGQGGLPAAAAAHAAVNVFSRIFLPRGFQLSLGAPRRPLDPLLYQQAKSALLKGLPGEGARSLERFVRVYLDRQARLQLASAWNRLRGEFPDLEAPGLGAPERAEVAKALDEKTLLLASLRSALAPPPSRREKKQGEDEDPSEAETRPGVTQLPTLAERVAAANVAVLTKDGWALWEKLLARTGTPAGEAVEVDVAPGKDGFWELFVPAEGEMADQVVRLRIRAVPSADVPPVRVLGGKGLTERQRSTLAPVEAELNRLFSFRQEARGKETGEAAGLKWLAHLQLLINKNGRKERDAHLSRLTEARRRGELWASEVWESLGFLYQYGASGVRLSDSLLAIKERVRFKNLLTLQVFLRSNKKDGFSAIMDPEGLILHASSEGLDPDRPFPESVMAHLVLHWDAEGRRVGSWSVVSFRKDPETNAWGWRTRRPRELNVLQKAQADSMMNWLGSGGGPGRFVSSRGSRAALKFIAPLIWVLGPDRLPRVASSLKLFVSGSRRGRTRAAVEAAATLFPAREFSRFWRAIKTLGEFLGAGYVQIGEPMDWDPEHPVGKVLELLQERGIRVRILPLEGQFFERQDVSDVVITFLRRIKGKAVADVLMGPEELEDFLEHPDLESAAARFAVHEWAEAALELTHRQMVEAGLDVDRGLPRLPGEPLGAFIDRLLSAAWRKTERPPLSPKLLPLLVRGATPFEGLGLARFRLQRALQRGEKKKRAEDLRSFTRDLQKEQDKVFRAWAKASSRRLGELPMPARRAESFLIGEVLDNLSGSYSLEKALTLVDLLLLWRESEDVSPKRLELVRELLEQTVQLAGFLSDGDVLWQDALAGRRTGEFGGAVFLSGPSKSFVIDRVSSSGFKPRLKGWGGTVPANVHPRTPARLPLKDLLNEKGHFLSGRFVLVDRAGFVAVRLSPPKRGGKDAGEAVQDPKTGRRFPVLSRNGRTVRDLQRDLASGELRLSLLSFPRETGGNFFGPNAMRWHWALFFKGKGISWPAYVRHHAHKAENRRVLFWGFVLVAALIGGRWGVIHGDEELWNAYQAISWGLFVLGHCVDLLYAGPAGPGSGRRAAAGRAFTSLGFALVFGATPLSLAHLLSPGNGLLLAASVVLFNALSFPAHDWVNDPHGWRARRAFRRGLRLVKRNRNKAYGQGPVGKKALARMKQGYRQAVTAWEHLHGDAFKLAASSHAGFGSAVPDDEQSLDPKDAEALDRINRNVRELLSVSLHSWRGKLLNALEKGGGSAAWDVAKSMLSAEKFYREWKQVREADLLEDGRDELKQLFLAAGVWREAEVKGGGGAPPGSGGGWEAGEDDEDDLPIPPRFSSPPAGPAASLQALLDLRAEPLDLERIFPETGPRVEGGEGYVPFSDAGREKHLDRAAGVYADALASAAAGDRIVLNVTELARPGDSDLKRAFAALVRTFLAREGAQVVLAVRAGPMDLSDWDALVPGWRRAVLLFPQEHPGLASSLNAGDGFPALSARGARKALGSAPGEELVIHSLSTDDVTVEPGVLARVADELGRMVRALERVWKALRKAAFVRTMA